MKSYNVDMSLDIILEGVEVEDNETLDDAKQKVMETFVVKGPYAIPVDELARRLKKVGTYTFIRAISIPKEPV